MGLFFCVSYNQIERKPPKVSASTNLHRRSLYLLLLLDRPLIMSLVYPSGTGVDGAEMGLGKPADKDASARFPPAINRCHTREMSNNMRRWQEYLAEGHNGKRVPTWAFRLQLSFVALSGGISRKTSKECRRLGIACWADLALPLRLPRHTTCVLFEMILFSNAHRAALF